MKKRFSLHKIESELKSPFDEGSYSKFKFGDTAVAKQFAKELFEGFISEFKDELLEQEEIPYFFENEMTLSVVPMYTSALGGIKLKVHPNDFEEVQQILDNLNSPLKIV